MKNISPSILPKFRGIFSEHPNEFLFKFKVLCRTYDYESDAKKLKLFPSTLKDNAMRWFMELPLDSISTWPKMERVLLEK